VSLNSHRRDLHDKTRGVSGAFDKAVKALRLLLEARARVPGSPARIYVMGTIFDENYRELEAFYNFVLNDIGADKLKLNFLQPSFAQDDAIDHFFHDHHGVDADELAEVLTRCNERFGLRFNPVWFEQVIGYWRVLGSAKDLNLGWGTEARTADHICDTYERNIMVDIYGNARLCFSHEFGSVKLERNGDLKRFWERSGAIRRDMTSCNRLCGISHSVRRESSTLDATRKIGPKTMTARAIDYIVDQTFREYVPR
jgi:MoaA/NifB/PqqE/SkfB family radical SAM enzyme